MPAFPKPQAERLRHIVSVRINDQERQLLAAYTKGKAKRVSDMLRVVLEDWIQQRDLRRAA
jgi:hypothetical protein